MAANSEKIEQEMKYTPENMSTSQPNSIADRLQASISPEAKQKINNILEEVNNFSDLEKLLLYLKLPSSGNTDGTNAAHNKSATPTAVARAEQTQAFNWIRSHLEESSDTSLPKHEVYEEYRTYCENSQLKYMSPADFGKIMKCMFPNVKGRRLGTRGNSRYCYSGIRKKTEVKPPVLPSLDSPQKLRNDLHSPSLCWKCQNSPEEEQVDLASSLVVCEWATKIFTKQFSSILDVADHLSNNNFVSKSMAALTIISYMADRNKKGNVDGSLLKLTQSDEDRHRETKHQLQRKIQHSQLVKMRQQQENRKKIQAKLGTDGGLVGDSNKLLQSLERSRSVPADRLFSDSDSASSSSEAMNLESKESQSSSSEGTGTSGLSTPQSQAVVMGVKDSPNKRRYTPIQPKTPVRDNNTIKAVPVTIPGLPKGNSQFFLLKNPNGSVRFATEVVQNGQKVLQVLDSPPVVTQTTNKPVTNLVCSKVSATPVATTTVAAPAVATPVATPVVAPANTKQMSQIVLVRPAANQGIVAAPTGVKTKTENIANAAILVSPNHHVLVSPVKTPVRSQTSLVNTSVATQLVAGGGQIMVQGAALQPTRQVQTGQVITAQSKNISAVVPASHQPAGVVTVLSPAAGSTSASQQVTIKKEVVSRGPTPSIEMSLGSPTPSTTNVNYVRAVVRLASPVPQELQSVSQPSSTTIVTLSSQTFRTVTTDSITSPQSTPSCTPRMATTSSIPHPGSAAALLKSLSSTVYSHNHQQVTSQQCPVQVSMQRPPPQQPNKNLLKQSAPSIAANAKVPITEIQDATTRQLQQVASTLQQHPQILQQQQSIPAASVGSVFVPSAIAHAQTTTGNQLQQMGILKTALMSPVSLSSSTQQVSIQVTPSSAGGRQSGTVLSTSDAVAKLDALQLHDNTHVQTLQENQAHILPTSLPGGVLSLQVTGNQHPGFIPVSGVKRLAVDPNSATVLTNSAAISLDSIQRKQQFQQLIGATIIDPQINQGVSSTGQSVINQTFLNTGNTSYPVSIVKNAEGTVSVIPVSQFSQGIVTQQIINTQPPSSVRSVPCTPTSGMQSPIPMTLTINGHVTPVMQQQSGATTPVPMTIGSVPPSPVAIDVSSGFIPIQQGIDQSRIASNASPVKRTKVKPRPTHPKQQGAEFSSQHGISLQETTTTGHFQQVEIASKPNFAAPVRKRRPSGQRRANANPYPLPGQRQVTPVASPCNSRCNTPVSPATPGNPDLDSINMPPPSPGLPPFDGTIMGGSRDLRNRSASPALWNAATTSGRRRNPSGPATYMQSVTRQHSIDANTYNQSDINNLNHVYIDHKGIHTQLPHVSQRSQSVPLPDLPEEARILGLHLQQQQLSAAVNLSQQTQQQISTSLAQSSNDIASQERVLADSLTGTELRGIQINNTCSNFNAKRNLTLELQEIEVTEDDFVADAAQAARNFLSPDGNSQSAGGSLFNELLQQTNQTHDVNQGASWTPSRGGDPTLASAPAVQNTSDLNVPFDMTSPDQPVSAPSSVLHEDQNLLFNQAMSGDASNSTSSTLNDDISNMEDALSDFGAGNGFDLSWQMGSNSNLSTLECGM